MSHPASEKAAASGGNDDDLDDFLNSLTDDAGPASAGGGDGDVDAEDLDKMLS